jgi:hypothetical protein
MIRTAVASRALMPRGSVRPHARGQASSDAQQTVAARSLSPPRTAVATRWLMPREALRPHARGQKASDAQKAAAARSSFSATSRDANGAGSAGLATKGALGPWAFPTTDSRQGHRLAHHLQGKVMIRTAVANRALMPMSTVRPHARGQDTSDAQSASAARSSSSQV